MSTKQEINEGLQELERVAELHRLPMLASSIAAYRGRISRELVDRPDENSPDLRGFVLEWLNTGDDYIPPDVDGGELQEMATKHRILIPTEATEPCGECCSCAEWDEFPMTCYRIHRELLTPDEGGGDG